MELVFQAASRGHRDCLDYILAGSPAVLASDADHATVAMQNALEGCSLACIERLEEAGCTWENVGPPGFEAVYKRNPVPIHFCGAAVPWGWCYLEGKIFRADYASILALAYEWGYGHMNWDPRSHPAVRAMHWGSVNCFKVVVRRFGWPAPCYYRAITLLAALKGEDMLRLVMGVGFTLHPLTAVVCARRGDVGALRWLFEIVPTSVTRLAKAAICEAAVLGNSLECLRYARQRGYLMGDISERMAHTVFDDRRRDSNDDRVLLTWSAEDVKGRQRWDVRMLRYLVQHMDPGWARGMLKKVAGVVEERLADCVEASSGGVPVFCDRGFQTGSESGIDALGVPWDVIIFLGNKLGDELPAGLAEMAAVRSKRAKALAGVVYLAGKLARAGQAHRCLASWSALACLPPALWERIAFEAHLAVPSHDALLYAK